MTYGTRWGPEGPPEEAYSRVTNPERFQPLHAAMTDIIARLQLDFDVERAEGYGLDEELEHRHTLAAPSVVLTPSDPGAAPIAIVFTDFPGLHVRFGRWRTEPFPDCGCDACDESAEGEIERLADMVDDVTAGRFREGIRIPLFSMPRAGWQQYEMWAEPKGSGRWSRGRSRLRESAARKLTGGKRKLDLNWKPWPRRQPPR